MPFCKKCDGWLVSDEPCWCKPFEIRDPINMEDDTEVIYDRCAEGAAEKYAECFNDETECSLLNGRPLEVFVNDEKYEVIAEATIDYTATNIE